MRYCDTGACGNKNFPELTDMIPKTFESKSREFPPFLFAVVDIHKRENGFFIE